MAEDYETRLGRLMEFIAEIPMDPYKIVSGGPNPTPYDENFKQQARQPNFSLPTNPLFKKYTETTHTTLVKSWASGGKLTTCNGFAGICGRVMGSTVFLANFELEELLKKNGKGHAWVEADRGQRPGPGDIFRSIGGMHLGVSLGIDNDNNWLTVESGQGGPSSGFDAVMRLKRQYQPGMLRGWCDMRAYFDPLPPLPGWAIGTWVIYCGNDTFYYKFNKYHEAVQYPWKPIGVTQNSNPVDKGVVEYLGVDTISVTWEKEGGVETFKYDRFDSFSGLNEKMSGTSSTGETLKGVRL